jgi:hypothetical protein
MDSYLFNQKPGTIFTKATPLEDDPAENSQADAVEDASEDVAEEYSDQLAESDDTAPFKWDGSIHRY